MRIAIVGGGAAAVGVLDALAVSEAGPGEVTVFEPSGELWRGRPYRADLDSVLVNAPPAIMSIRHGDPGHYAAWLGPERAAAHLDALLGRPLVPRALYGRYLADTAEAALGALRARGWRTHVVPARVVAVTRSASALALRIQEGTTQLGPHADGGTARFGSGVGSRGGGGQFVADHVVLCVGGGTPQDHYGLDGMPGFVRDPYPLAGTVGRVPGGARVAVIGSGLTAVDVVVSLAARGHAGPIALVSRSGVLPHVWQRPLGYRPVHVTADRVRELCRANGVLTLDDLAGLLRAELADAGEDLAVLAADLLAAASEEPVRRLRRQLDAVGDPAIGRRVLQETAHTVGPLAWRLLPETERERLRRHFRLATSVASPMVPANAAILLRLFDAGQLSVTAGVNKIEPARHGNGFRILGDQGVWEADVVINAVNPAPQAVPRGAEAMITSLLGDRLAALHPSGGLVPADPRVHVVGDLAGGGPFITSGIPGIAGQAAAVLPGLR